MYNQPLLAATNPYERDLNAFIQNFQLSAEDIAHQFPELPFKSIDLKAVAYSDFLENLLPYHNSISKFWKHKKKMEMFISYSLLKPGPDAVFMDAAGGGYSYAGMLTCKQAYLQDIEIRDKVKQRVGKRVNYIEASVANIPLPDNSVDAIACHHAFEHFQGTADSDFIREAQRILKPSGKLVIIPIFLSRNQLELTNKADFTNWSTQREFCLFDPNATLPGKYSGNFARIYSTVSFRDRILRFISPEKADVTIIEPTIEGRPIPDPLDYSQHQISNFNYPYRALQITKK